MLRIVFMEKGKNTKAKNFRTPNIGNILKIVKLKIWLMVRSTNAGESHTSKLFQISN